MHIILTHEQADFDALASLLGAYILNEAYIPILPHRMNRNLHAFLNLYGTTMPFMEYHDLPSEPVESIILVDTQSLITVKGAGPHTKVQVVDHHPTRPGLPTNWEICSQETGANTTILVECIEQRGLILDVIQATLLLLGIYEDTGSLTYRRTTARDLRAAAYLLEGGADLDLAADLLNHPLSLEQEAFYNKLKNNAETYTINGHIIVIASGDGRDLNEELSTVAHKLRNLLDPDALIILVLIRGGVQMIARSSTERIDVGVIAAHFGGGGHSLAAAALIHDEAIDLRDITDKVLNTLPLYIKPAISVAQIMSTTPHLLSPDTPVSEVAHQMQRYGYEGYPVVQDGKVVGLLTRRAVDRAMTHKINLPARSLMQAGNITVNPDDSIGHLQALMIDSGWGQVPVVDPGSDKIVGIVTRTDLLKTLLAKPPLVGRQNLASLLEKKISPARVKLLQSIAQVAKDEHTPLYVVGGFVRDLILNRMGIDFDLVVEGDAIGLARALSRKFGGRLTSHVRFGTAKWYLTGTQFLCQPRGRLGKAKTSPKDNDIPESLDLITARLEFYTHPTALPSVERGSIKLDLHRRDFTINTLALRLDGEHYGELLDYWGGLGDLNKGIVRVLHSLSFVDDPTRMLRAVRYEQRYNFTIEERTMQLLLEARSLVDRVSGDRIRHELDHILDEEQSVAMLTRLHNLGLLSVIHPHIIWDERSAAHIGNCPQEIPPVEWQIADNFLGEKRVLFKRWLTYGLWFIHIPCDRIESVLKRLKMPVRLVGVIHAACQLWYDLPSLEKAMPSDITTRLEQVPPFALYVTYLATDDMPHFQTMIYNYVSRWRDIIPTIDGDDLRQRGLPPGPAYRRILTSLRSAWLDGKISNRNEEAALFEGLLAREKKGEL